MELLTNTDPSLRGGWHPVAAASGVGPGRTCVRLLGRAHVVERTPTGLVADAHGVREHLGLVWLAPQRPVAGLLAVPEAADPAFTAGWLAPQRAATSAGQLADNFLDVAHFPFVHAATFGSPDDRLVPRHDVTDEREGFSLVYEHAYRNVEDPGVAAGLRPLVQRRRVSYRYVPPFQLRLRLDHLDSGGSTVIVFLLQPEGPGSTAIWCQVLRDDLGGEAGLMDEAVAFEQAVLDEDLALSATFLVPGLPLDPTAEMHTRADAAGLALRRHLRALRSAA